MTHQPDSAIESGILRKVKHTSDGKTRYCDFSTAELDYLLERLQKPPAVVDVEKLRKKFGSDFALHGDEYLGHMMDDIDKWFVANIPQGQAVEKHPAVDWKKLKDECFDNIVTSNSDINENIDKAEIVLETIRIIKTRLSESQQPASEKSEVTTDDVIDYIKDFTDLTGHRASILAIGLCEKFLITKRPEQGK